MCAGRESTDLAFPEPDFVEVDSEGYVEVIFGHKFLGRRLAVLPFESEVDEGAAFGSGKAEAGGDAVFLDFVTVDFEVVVDVVGAEAVGDFLEVRAADLGSVLGSEAHAPAVVEVHAGEEDFAVGVEQWLVLGLCPVLV